MLISGADLWVRYDPGFRPRLTFFMRVSTRRDGTLGGNGDQEVPICRLCRKPTADWEEAASRRHEKRRFVLQHRWFAPHWSRELCLLPRPSWRHLQASFLLLLLSPLKFFYIDFKSCGCFLLQMERRKRRYVRGWRHSHDGSLCFGSKRLRCQSRRWNTRAKNLQVCCVLCFY